MTALLYFKYNSHFLIFNEEKHLKFANYFSCLSVDAQRYEDRINFPQTALPSWHIPPIPQYWSHDRQSAHNTLLS